MALPSPKPRLVLVTKDEPVIAISLEDALSEGGFSVAGPFARCAPALAWMEEHTPDVALLDVKLTDELCTDVAHALAGRGVPMVFLSGGSFPSLRSEFPNAPWFEKPTEWDEVIQTLHGLVDGARRRERLAESSSGPQHPE